MNPNAISILKANPEKINWFQLSRNPNAIHLIERQLAEEPEEIDWRNLSENPNAVPILERQLSEDPKKIHSITLSCNPNAIHLLEKHPEQINWCWLSTNPAIFTYDYIAIKNHRTSIKEEIIQYVNSPKRLTKWLQDEHNTIEEFYELYG